MNKKSLPIATPPIVAFQYLAFPLAILSDKPDYLPWFHSNYIQLICHKDLSASKVLFLDFYGHVFDENFNNTIYFTYHPWLEIKHALVGGQTDIIPNLIECMQYDYYVYLKVDEFFIPDRSFYQKDHFVHDVLVFGYDLHEKSLDVIGFNNKGQFLRSRISVDQFDQAYKSGRQMDKNRTALGFHEFFLFKYKQNGKYDFDLDLVAELLDDYLNSRNTSDRFRMFKNPQNPELSAFGMEIYRYLIDYCRLLMEDLAEYDIRPFHLLWEHKKCMLSRMEFIQTNCNIKLPTSLIGSYGEIEKKCNEARMAVLKFYFTKDKSLIAKTIKLIDFVQTEEAVILTVFARLLSSQRASQ